MFVPKKKKKKIKYSSLGLFIQESIHHLLTKHTHTHTRYCRKHRYYFKHQGQALTHVCWHTLHFTAHTHTQNKLCKVTTGKLKNVHDFHWCAQTSFIIDIQTPKQAFSHTHRGMRYAVSCDSNNRLRKKHVTIVKQRVCSSQPVLASWSGFHGDAWPFLVRFQSIESMYD